MGTNPPKPAKLRWRETESDDTTAPLLEAIRFAAGEFNALAERANSEIDRIDTELEAAHVGMTVWVVDELFDEVDVRDDAGSTIGTERTFVGYAKGGGGWGVSLRVVRDIGGRQSETIHRVRDAGRDERVRAFTYIPQVLRRIAECLHERREGLDRRSVKESGGSGGN